MLSLKRRRDIAQEAREFAATYRLSSIPSGIGKTTSPAEREWIMEQAYRRIREIQEATKEKH